MVRSLLDHDFGVTSFGFKSRALADSFARKVRSRIRYEVPMRPGYAGMTIEAPEGTVLTARVRRAQAMPWAVDVGIRAAKLHS